MFTIALNVFSKVILSCLAANVITLFLLTDILSLHTCNGFRFFVPNYATKLIYYQGAYFKNSNSINGMFFLVFIKTLVFMEHFIMLKTGISYRRLRYITSWSWIAIHVSIVITLAVYPEPKLLSYIASVNANVLTSKTGFFCLHLKPFRWIYDLLYNKGAPTLYLFFLILVQGSVFGTMYALYVLLHNYYGLLLLLQVERSLRLMVTLTMTPLPGN